MYNITTITNYYFFLPLETILMHLIGPSNSIKIIAIQFVLMVVLLLLLLLQFVILQILLLLLFMLAVEFVFQFIWIEFRLVINPTTTATATITVSQSITSICLNKFVFKLLLFRSLSANIYKRTQREKI